MKAQSDQGMASGGLLAEQEGIGEPASRRAIKAQQRAMVRASAMSSQRDEQPAR